MRAFVSLVVAFACLFANAMPLGLRTAMWGEGDYETEVSVIESYTVSFNANGGSVSPTTRKVAKGAAVGALPRATRNGYKFLGWFTAVRGGNQIYSSTVVLGNVTYYAHWQKESSSESDEALYDSVVGPAPTMAASEYNGYLVDAKGEVKGTILVKVGKPGKKDGKASVKATAQIGAKKVTMSAADRGKAVVRTDGPTTVALVADGARAGKLTMKGGVFDDSKAGANPSGLKLTYSAKGDSFKGSFKAYSVVGGKLKATAVNVSGVMIGGRGYGTAMIKKLGSVSISIE